MGLIKGILIFALILIAVAHFFPEQYNNARSWVVDKTSTYTTDGVGNGVATITNFAKIPADQVKNFKCATAKDCEEQFDIKGLSCSGAGTCYVATTENVTEDDFDLGSYFTDNFEAYFDNRSTNCELAGGEWISETDRIGCYDIPVWDSAAACSTAEITFMRGICINVKGVYTCNAHQVSCEV